MQQGGLGQAGQCLVRALNDDIRPGSNGTALPAVGGGQWQIVRAVGFVHDQGNVGGVAVWKPFPHRIMRKIPTL